MKYLTVYHYYLLVLLLMEMRLGETITSLKYEIGERTTRGLQVMINSSVPNKIICAGACTALKGCLGYNWISGNPNCQLLSGLRTVQSDPKSNIYVPDIFPVSVVPLAYSCSNCMHPNPWSYDDVPHRCNNPRGLVAGLTLGASSYDIDDLLCVNVPGLLMTFSGGYTCMNNTRSCKSLGIANRMHLAPDSVWSDQQFYISPTNFRLYCRIFQSPEKIDYTRCLQATTSTLNLKKVLKCPPHMVAINAFVNVATPALVECCLMYY